MRNPLILSLVLLALIAPREGVGTEIPERPEQIEFPSLKYDPPRAESFRRVLDNGVPIYLAPSTELPLIQVTFTFRGGSYLDPVDKIGLAGLAGRQIRQGGTNTISAEALDEKLDFLASEVSTFSGAVTSSATFNCLRANFDETFALFMDMLRNPGFQEDRFQLAKENRLGVMKQRNDDAGSILAREWNALMNGRDHFSGRVPTQATLESLRVEDLRAFHARVFHPGNLIIGVSGDFDPDTMTARLSAALKDWKKGETVALPPAPEHDLPAGMFRVEKDIPQGKVQLGLTAIQRDDPDYFPLLLMNNILGGSGFTSRITSRVRSDEGLAYSAGSALSPGTFYRGEFRAFVQSKNRTVALATKIILEEIDRIRKDPVSEQELETAKASYVETFPRTFGSNATAIQVFIDDEWTGRDPEYWKTYRKKIEAVTKEDVLRVAKKHLDPAKVCILVVGKWEDIEPGDLDGRASMKEFFEGKSTELPLRDPMTQEPLTDN